MHQTVLEHTDQKDGENSVYFRCDKEAHWLLTFNLGKSSDGDRTDVRLPDSGWQARA